MDLTKQARQPLGLIELSPFESIEGSEAVTEIMDLTAESSAEHVGLTRQARQPLGLIELSPFKESLMAGRELVDSLAPNFLPLPPKINYFPKSASLA